MSRRKSGWDNKYNERERSRRSRKTHIASVEREGKKPTQVKIFKKK